MPTRISSREVLAYLNDLGYNNINAQQLKEFIYDLKKLIKHDERKKSETSVQRTTDSSLEPQDVFFNLHRQGTVASNSRTVGKKESVISVQIKKNKSQARCSQHDKENIVPPETVQSKQSLEPEQPHKETQTNDLNGAKSRVSLKKTNSKPKASFIRPLMTMNRKSDPVALYHQYQAEWKKHKVPGEDHRAELRWAIREKLLGGPQVRQA